MHPSIRQTQAVNQNYLFTITSGNATVGSVYSNSGNNFTTLVTIASSTSLNTSGVGAPAASGTLTKVSGTGDATITYSAFTTAATGTTALASNPARIAWQIQNQDNVGPLYVLMGSGASSTVYHEVLKACTSAHDGTGGSYNQGDGAVYTGIITVYSASTTPIFSILEIAP